MIIAGFPCIGKTTMAKKYNNVLDLFSTKFHYLIADDSLDEDLKGNESNLKPHPNWPQNYIEEIQAVKDKYDVVFVLARDYILEEMNKLKISYLIAVPEENLKQEYITRAVLRGNTKNFVLGFDVRYDKWRNMMLSQPAEKIYLKKGEYIEDALKRLKLFGG